jgi:hypothetical protein
MSNSASFRLNRNALLLAVISVVFTGEADAAAARAEFIYGSVTVSGADGVERPLARGTELDNGDTVRTTDGRAQLRFTDGAYVSLQPNTEFAIKDYRFEGRTDGSERGFFGLAKGAMRTVTGLVGRVNRNRYQITTPTATVGIRGTGGVIQVLNDGATLIVGTSGIWSLTNPAGSIDVPAGVSAIAPVEPTSAPQQTSQAPQSGPAPLAQQTLFAQGEQRAPTGDPVGISTPLVVSAGYTAAIAYGIATEGGEAAVSSDVDAMFNASGQLTEFTDPFGNSFKLGPSGTHGLRPDGTPDFGSDAILKWGRWVGPVTATAFAGTADYGARDGFHYVIALPTPVLPTSGSATYSLLGATSPTYAGGGAPPGKVTSGSLTVGFNAASYTVNLVSFGVEMPGASYLLDGQTSSSQSFFTLSSSQLAVKPSGTACAASCSAIVNGFFAGANAERAGISYRISDFDLLEQSKTITGAAAFKKN